MERLPRPATVPPTASRKREGELALGAALLSISLMTAPSIAAAHGRPPRVERIAFDPNDPDRIVLSATVGLLVSGDAGESWIWVCSDSFGADPTQEQPDVVVMGDGSVVIATFDGITRGEPDLCDFTFPEGPARDVYVVDVAAHPTDDAIVFGLSSSGVVDDRVLRSEDDGVTWAAVGEPIADILTEKIAIAPSDPSRVYVSGATTDPSMRRAFVLRSSDGGETFEPTELTLVDGERRAEVVLVDPTNADRLWVRMARGNVDPRNERLFYSDDGGATFTSIFELQSMVAFAISDDGQTVWAGSATGQGVWIARAGATTFEQVSDLDVRCLATHEGLLYLCVDQLTEGFALGRSADEGMTVDELMGFEDAQMLPECPRCSRTGEICPAWVPDLTADLRTYFAGQDAGMTGLPRDAGIPAECRADAGPPPPDAGPPPPPSSNCACRAAPAPSHGWPLALLGLALVLRARRGSRSADR